MPTSRPAHTSVRPRPSAPALTILLAAVLVAALAVAVAIVVPQLAGLFGGLRPAASASAQADPEIRDLRGPDGAVPDGTTVFDDDVAAVARLDPDLLAALRDAASDAADDGVTFLVTSGWRSPELQDRLLHDAVEEYGSAAEAARWVATADTSPHVQGDAIDVGKWDAMDWLAQRGAAYGLCQVYANEPWHYELRAEAVRYGCPAMYADPTHDPRMQR